MTMIYFLNWNFVTALLVTAAAGTTDKRHTAVDSENGDLIMPKCNSSLHYNRLKGWGSCPLLATCKNGSCSCFESQWSLHILCTRSYLEITPCMCFTYNSANASFIFGWSIFCCANKGQAPLNYVRLPNNISNVTATMCQELNRNGTMCGSCANGHWPLVYSYNLSCVMCPHNNNNLIRYFALTLASTTIFYMIILIFRVSITSPYVYCFIFYVQAISTPNMIRTVMMYLTNKPIKLALVKFLSSFYAIWSLDFFRAYSNNYCLKISIFNVYVLELLLVLYPIFLMAFSFFLMKSYNNNNTILVFLWRPFQWLISFLDGQIKNTRSLVDAYSVFLIVSVTKVFYVCVDVLFPVLTTIVYSSGSHNNYVTFLDGSIDYLKGKHIPYAILVFVFVAVYFVLPTVFLFFYTFQFSQNLLNQLPLRVRMTLQHFVDKFQGYYKDGTGGHRDCRCFSVFYLVLTAMMFALYAANGQSFFLLGSSTLALASSLFFLIQPYRDAIANKIAYCFLLLLSLQYLTIYITSSLSFNKSLKEVFECLAIILSFLPLLYISVFTSYALLKETSCCEKITRLLKEKET